MENDDWEVLKDENNPPKEILLGKGGQGKVYLVREPKRTQKRKDALTNLRTIMPQIPNGSYDVAEFAENLSVLSRPDLPISAL